MYGYHPLSLSLLVGLINEDHEQRGDIEAVKNLEIFENVKARRHHVLQRAYESLAPERRDLLSKISCFRGSMEYDTIKKVFASKTSGNFLTKLFKHQADEKFDLDKALLDLRKRGLLQYVSPLLAGEGSGVRYDMHPIVRHYAYDHFADEKRRKEAHVKLAEHFIDAMPVTNAKVKTLEDLAPVIELYHHMVRAGDLDEAVNLFSVRLSRTLYFQFGAYQLEVELMRALFPDGEDKLPRLKTDNYKAWTLSELASAYAMNGQPSHSVPLFEMQNTLQEKAGDKKNFAVGLGNVAGDQLKIGTLSAAERNLCHQIDICREIEEDGCEAAGHQDLGEVLSYRGVWQDAEQELDVAIAVKVWKENLQGCGVNFAYRALRFLLMARTNPQYLSGTMSQIENLKSSIECAQRALELADEQAKDIPFPRDYVRAYWLLGAAYRANNELTIAEENLSKALNLCRQINMVDHEADILLDLARLRYAQGDFKDAQEKASEALVITERSGYVLQGADVNLFLATLALEGYRLEGLKVGSDKDAAIHHAKEALRLATCDGGEYKYKVAYDEAVAMLEKLK
jgi:tetratricopeptide (TPR) repeat protein